MNAVLNNGACANAGNVFKRKYKTNSTFTVSGNASHGLWQQSKMVSSYTVTLNLWFGWLVDQLV